MILGYRNTTNLLVTYLCIVGMSIVSYVVRTAKFDAFSPQFQLNLSLLAFVVVAITWEVLRFINRYLNAKIPFEKSVPRRIVLQLLLGALVGLIVRSIIYFFGEPYLPFKLDELFVATTWMIYMLIPTIVNLGFFTVYFIERWKDSLLVTERLEKEKSQVQFDNLKNQLNPHFLFNALTSLNSLIHENPDLASEFLQQLSKVYRYVLQNKDKTTVSLETELNFIQHYVQLLGTRFTKSLLISFDIDERSKELSIVPVTLQILIENAIKHNIVDDTRPLKICISTIDGYLHVKNNLQLKKRVEESNKQGLENLRTLYRYLTVAPLEQYCTAEEFVVKIPLI
jgi:two-component system, LytTR family, sensor kinase